MGERVLVAGPWFGEIGLLIMWLGGCRFMAKSEKWKRVVVIGPTGWGVLAADFADEYIAQPFKGVVPCGCHARPIGYVPTKDEIAACQRAAAKGEPFTVFPAVETYPIHNHPGNRFRDPMGSNALYVKHGSPRAKFNGCIVLHARWRTDWGDERNWPPEKWAELIGMLKRERPKARIICVGSKDGALLVGGAEDFRGVPVKELIDILASAALVVGPSSGPMHLASLCDATHVTWVGYDAQKRSILVNRYMRDWRPHGTPLACVEAPDWKPGVGDVCGACKHMLNGGGERRGKQQVAPPKVAVAVLCYGGLKDSIKAVESIRKHTRAPHELIVVDNSDDWKHAHWLAEHDPAVTYIRMGRNTGCTVPRNVVARYCWGRRYKYFVFMDQDVEITEDGWLADMVAVAEKEGDTGAVGWPVANKVAPEHPVDETGCVPELPGMCNLYRTEAAVKVPWDERFFAYRFDSWWHLLAGKKGWKTRIVTGKGDKIAHEHPHSGVNRNPEMPLIRRRSEALFQQLLAEHGIANPFLQEAVT